MFSPLQTTKDYMSVVLTHVCNKKCPFCVDLYRGRKEFINEESVNKALLFARTNNIKDVLLIGGEPTLHPDVISIAQAVKRAGFRCLMTTNYTKPQTVAALDGIVDCYNISFYNQPLLPKQKDFKSDLTLHALIHDKQLTNKDELDAFIDSHQENGHLKFSTLLPINTWSVEHQQCSYLNDLDCEWCVLFNEILGQQYRGTIIKRYDRLINKTASQSFKVHVDGNISQTWNRDLEEAV